LGGATSGNISKNRGLITHQADINKIYFMGSTDSIYQIVMSSDRGATLVDKTGNWISVFGCSPVRRALFNYQGGLIYPIFGTWHGVIWKINCVCVAH